MRTLDFVLPEDLEATEPPPVRDGVRLLVARPEGLTNARFSQLGEFLAPGDLVVVNTSATLAAAVDGLGIIHLFEAWLQPHLDSGALVPLLKPWWQPFSGPYLYYPGRKHLPAPLRAFVDFVRAAENRHP